MVADTKNSSFLFDQKVVLVDCPWYTVGRLFYIVSYTIHPREDTFGRMLPFDSPNPDRNASARVRYLEVLAQKLIESVEQKKIILKDELELVIEAPVKRELLNSAKMYKSQISVFLRTLRIQADFKSPAELYIENSTGDNRKLVGVYFDKYAIEEESVEDSNDARDGLDAKLSEKGAAGDEIEIPNKGLDSVVAVNYKVLANAFKVEEREDINLKWFKERCSNWRRYPGFKDALVEEGKRGGGAATFNVLQVVAHLGEKGNKEKIPLRLLRSSIKKNFPEILQVFDDLFDLQRD